MNNGRTLHGRRVVVTRAAEQAGTLAELLAAQGAQPVLVPLVRIADEPQGVAELAALDPAEFDWAIVTSPNGAARLVERLAAVDRPPRLAAVGESTAGVLRAHRLTVDLVPLRQSAAGLLAELTVDAGGRVLVVQAFDAADDLEVGLRSRGAEVVVVRPYRAVPAVPSAAEQLAALSADAVLFASGSAARAWVAAFGTSTPPVVVAIGPSTAQAARSAGLKVTAVAADHSLGGMVDALERSLRGED